jgi:hypothetical protein
VTERWVQELRRLRKLELPARVWEHAQQGPSQTLEPSAPRRLVAAGVAVTVFVGAGVLAWMALGPLAERPTP